MVGEFKKLGRVVFMPGDLRKELADSDILVIRSRTRITRELLNDAKRLKIIAMAGVGLDHINLDTCKERGITVISTPHASTNSTAELTIGLMIALLRKTVKADKNIRKGVWNREQLLGNEICGKTLGVIGFGRVGKLVGKKADALGMNVLAYSPHAKNSKYAKAVPFSRLLEKSDIISIHTALVPETVNLIDSNIISKMKGGVYLLNMARGRVVNEDAVCEALKNGKISGMALDTTIDEPCSHKELLEMDNVIFSSHTGGNTHEAQIRIGRELIGKIKEIFNGHKV